MKRRVDMNSAQSVATEAVTTRPAAAHGSSLSAGPTAGRAVAVLTPGLIVPPSVQAKLLLLQGKLLRRDRTFLTWKWRDFYLEQQRLQYFNEKGVRKGEILITATTPIMIRLLSEPKPFGFLVFIKDEKLTLAAATAQDRQKWIDVFTELFHANIEDFQASAKAANSNSSVSGSSVVTDKQEKKRTRPTFLPIPDMSEDEGSGGSNASLLHLHNHAAAGSRTPVLGAKNTPVLGSKTPVLGAASAPGSQGSGPVRSTLGRRQSEGALPLASSAAALATAAAAAASALSVKAVNTGGDTEPELQERRSFYRNSDGALAMDVAIPRSKFIALKEQYSNVTFPRTLANGDVLVGVGPLVRRMGWTDERILAVGLYVDADAAAKEMLRFSGRSLKSVRGDQAFYDFLVQHSKFRRSIVVTCRKRVSKSVLIALLHDEIAPRMSGSTEALHTFLHFIEKSLRKAESMMLRIHPEGGRLDFRLRGQQYPPIASSLLCQCIQSVFFDVNSIQQDAKRRLIERFPLLWGMEELPEDTLLALGNSDRDMFGHELEPRHNGTLSESEDDDDDDDEDDDEDIAAPKLRRVSTSASESVASSAAPRRVMSMKEKLDQLDEEEHELIRRESRSLGVHFGPIVDKDSNVQFKGDLLVDGSTLLGTWSQKITYTVDADAPEKSCIVSVGLYTDSIGVSEALLKYKGLSVGSILQDPDFFARFADGPFAKHLVFKVQEPMSVAKLVDYFTARVRRRGSGAGYPGGNESGRSSDAKVRQLLERLEDQRIGNLRPADELQVTIASDTRMTLTVNRLFVSEEEEEEYPSVAGMSVAAAPFSSTFQGIFYGYHTLDPASRTQLIERLPSLLDVARDDLAQTYYDEIQVLRENYKRQLPEFRLKAGYMLISFEKKKMAKNAEGVKEQTITASKWSKRWCRLDGTTFSYFSHKHSRKPREIIDLTKCTVSEITASSTTTGLAPFAFDKGKVRPSIRIGIAKSNGEILALKTESIFEGVEWLESLVEASDVKSRQIPQASDGEDTDQAAIETSGGGDADESSGVVDGDDVEGEDDDLLPASARRVSGHRDALVGLDGAVVDKHGSLLSWILEDSRHAFIVALLVLIAWLITSQQPVFIQKVASGNGFADANSSTDVPASPSTGH